MVKTINNYFTHSGIWVTIILNPAHWMFSWQYGDEVSPHALHTQIGPVFFRMVISNGDY